MPMSVSVGNNASLRGTGDQTSLHPWLRDTANCKTTGLTKIYIRELSNNVTLIYNLAVARRET